MIAQLRSEVYKWLTTRTHIGVLVSMVVLIMAAVLVHAFGLPVARLQTDDQQYGILLDVGANIGALFSALLGALCITSEFRTGTIRPTVLVRPRRPRVFAAKVVCSLAAGAIAGVLAAGSAVAGGWLGLTIRGVSVQVATGEVGRLLVGALVGGALWAALGLAVGAIARSQVPTVVGLVVWLLFVENLLAGDLPTAHQYTPGGLAQALAGSTRDAVLTSVPLAATLLLAYAAAGALLGAAALSRRDVS
ncbi:MAG TPA: hypothetical protein VH561_15735 [Micromonosporaceae bacterium]|jgi:ABC-type transport system involved in multi-copper enzyme maturation permease subunit